jgi:hypothetical protein
LTARQVPAAFLSWRVNGPALPLKAKSWESVCWPPGDWRREQNANGMGKCAHTAISPPTTGEEVDLGSGGAAGVEVEACLGLGTGKLLGEQGSRWCAHQRADNEHSASLVVVLPSCDDVPFLAAGSVAGSDLNGRQVRAGVS